MYALSNIKIVQNGIVFPVPCPLVPYLEDIRTLLPRNSVQNAFIQVAAKYNIMLFPPEPVVRRIQQYPARPFKQLSAQAVDAFILGTQQNYNNISYDSTTYRVYRGDGRFLTTFNSESATMNFARMKVKSEPLSYLFRGEFPKAAICVPISENLPIHTGMIMYAKDFDPDSPLIFVPLIHNKLIAFYSPITKPNTTVFFRNIGCSLEQNSREVAYKYTKSTDLNTITSSVS